MDNSGARKAGVTHTYQGFDGHTPIAGYLGNECCNIGLELRPGSQHPASETDSFYKRLFSRVERLVQAGQPVLLHEDSGFDSALLFFAKAALHLACRRRHVCDRRLRDETDVAALRGALKMT